MLTDRSLLTEGRDFGVVSVKSWRLADLGAKHALLLAGMEPMEAVIRSSGQYGPRVPVKDDADAQTKMLGFIGRDPDWTPR